MKSAATLTIRDAKHMHARGRKSVAAWLRKQARVLLRQHDKLSNRYTARYLYR